MLDEINNPLPDRRLTAPGGLQGCRNKKEKGYATYAVALYFGGGCMNTATNCRGVLCTSFWRLVGTALARRCQRCHCGSHLIHQQSSHSEGTAGSHLLAGMHVCKLLSSFCHEQLPVCTLLPSSCREEMPVCTLLCWSVIKRCSMM